MDTMTQDSSSTSGGSSGNVYMLTWGKKKDGNGTVQNSINLRQIDGMYLMRSRRPLAYRPADGKLYLAADKEDEAGLMLPVRETKTSSADHADDKKGSGSGPDNHHFSFGLSISGGGGGGGGDGYVIRSLFLLFCYDVI